MISPGHGFSFPFVCAGALLAVSVANAQIPGSDFDDGTLQGWSMKEPFGGTLTNPGTGGHPGGFLFVTDTVSEGGQLLAVAPSSYLGDLAGYPAIQWDEFIYVRGAGGSRTTQATDLFLTGGPNGTTYRLANNPLTLMGAWHTRLVELKASNFVLMNGSDSFEEVIQNVSELGFEMDTSTLANGGPESGIDNVRLLNALPVLQNVGAPALAGNQIRLEWRGVPSAAHRVEFSSSLVTESWETIATVNADGAGQVTYESMKPPDSPAGFYRLAYP